MRIAFVIIGNAERGGCVNGESIRYGGVGSSGTDSSAILVAEYLAKQGHDVVFACESGNVGTEVNGVFYTNLNFSRVENKTFDSLITSLWFEKFNDLSIVVTQSLIYWCHLSWMYSMNEMVEFATKNNLILGVVHVSNWEKSHNQASVNYMAGRLKNVKTAVIPNAIVTDVALDVLKKKVSKKPRKTIFHAQWSRGGPTALEVVKKLGWNESDFVSFDYLRAGASGRLDKKALFNELADSEYFIFPSFTHGRLIYKDTFSCAVAEALAMGVIVVAYPLGALPEYYQDYCSWVDFPQGTNLEKLTTEKVSEDPLFGNVDNMVAKVNYLENSPLEKQKLASCGEYVLNRFSIDNVGPMWEKYLSEITTPEKMIVIPSLKMNEPKPFDSFEKRFYINLDYRVDRNDQVVSEFSKYGIQCERFSAVSMSLEESVKMTESGCATWDISVTKQSKEQSDAKVRAQRSCTMSHIEIIKRAKLNDWKNVLIFEDDVIFNGDVDLNIELKKCLVELNEVNWDLFVFGCNPRMKFFKKGNHIAKLRGFYNAHAVVVNNTMYDRIIDFPFKTHMVIDQLYYGLAVDGAINAYTPLTPLAFQRESFSDIEQNSYTTEFLSKDAYKEFLV